MPSTKPKKMLRNSFQARIASVLVLLLLTVIGSLYVAVQQATRSAVSAQAAEQLEVGTRVFEELLEARGIQLRDAVRVLSADFGFKEAVASSDADTIRSALANHGARINANVVMMFDLSGRIEVSTDPRFVGDVAQRLSSQVTRHQREGVQIYLMPIEDSIYLLVQATVSAPLPIARVVMGFQVDNEFTRELQSVAHLDLALRATQRGLDDIWISSLPDQDSHDLAQMIPATGDHFEDLKLDQGQRYLAKKIVLASGNGFEVSALLYKSLTQAQQAFAPLDKNILLIALVALLASLVGALLLARNISRPVTQLAAVAERIGQGDYEVPLELNRSDELGKLAQSFQTMQQGIAERQRLLSHNALHDPLTGLPNRALSLELLSSAVMAERPVALLYMGICDFKRVNQSCGTSAADQVLRQLGERLQSVLRPGDSLARIIADEFLILLNKLDGGSAVAYADMLTHQLAEPFTINGVDVTLEVRVGISAFPEHGRSPEELLMRAAIAMQDAANMQGHVQVYKQGRDIEHERQIRLIRELRHAPSRNELLLNFQPKTLLAGASDAHAEALLRWSHPELGVISPGEFIPLAERTGSIHLLTGWVMEAALRQLADWRSRGLIVHVSLNISTADLLDRSLAARVSGLLNRYKIDPGLITFEITESGVMLNPEVALQVLHDLRACGIALAVDDFGTGYSSLTQLKRMPVQELKIDQSFIRQLDEHSEDAVIVRSTIEMGHSLGLKVVAEGVELESSAKLLKHWGCDFIQGYLISRPLSAQAFEAWAKSTEQTSALPVS